MKTLDRYLLRRFAGVLAKTLLALVSFYVLIDLLTHRRPEILKLDVPWNVVLAYYVAIIPEILTAVVPFSVLIAGLFVLGETAQNNEITAALAGGVSLRRFVRAPVLVALCFAGALFAFQETVGARATREAEHIEQSYFSRNPDSERAGVTWPNLAGDWTCRVLKFNRIALTGEKVLIHAIRPDTVEEIRANRIFWDDDRLRWILEDGYWYVFPPGVELELSRRRITQLLAPIQETPEELFALSQPAGAKSARELSADIGQAAARGVPVQDPLVDLHEKLAQPALCFVMILLAIPFALRLRRGGLAISFGASIAVAIGYLMLNAVCVSMGRAGRLDPFVAAWLANAVFFVVGLTLYWRTPT